MNGNYLSHVRGVIEEEFHRIGMKIEVINVNVAREPIHTLRSSYQPIAYSSGMATMEIEFFCNETQFEYLSPFIERYEQNDIHHYPDVGWSTQHNAFEPLIRPVEIEARYRCTIVLHLTGGSMQTFIESFREATNKLFIAMESKAFDDEVVRTLSEE